MPDMPAPPMPTMCTRCSSCGQRYVAVQLRSAALTAALSAAAPRATSRATSATRCAASRWPAIAAAAVIAVSRGRVGEQPGHRVGDELRGQVGVVDQQPAAGIDHGQRVEPLLAVADGQRDVHRGQSDGGHLGHRHRAGPADRQIGGGVGEIHPVQVGHGDIGRVAVGGLAQIAACSSGRARAAPRHRLRQGLRRQRRPRG